MPDPDDVALQADRRFLELQSDFRDALEVMISGFRFEGLSLDEAIQQAARRFERLIQSIGGPVFDDEGYLPPMQTCTQAEVARWFGRNPHRERLLNRVHHWTRLARAVRARGLLLNGSFVTAKDEPGDVDAVVLLPEDFDDQLDDGKSEAVELTRMIFSGEPKELFAAEHEEDWWRWFDFFSQTRTGRRKGLVEVTL